jgi:hypothetical protein
MNTCKHVMLTHKKFNEIICLVQYMILTHYSNSDTSQEKNCMNFWTEKSIIHKLRKEVRNPCT